MGTHPSGNARRYWRNLRAECAVCGGHLDYSMQRFARPLYAHARARKLLIAICFAATQGELQSRLARKLSQIGH
jgi:hypothetical protein